MSGNPRPRITQNWRSAMVVYQLIPTDAIPNNPETNPTQKLISNILPAIITNNKSLAAIFPFELEKPSQPSLFSGATFEEKPITVIYTDVKIDGHSIKLILDSEPGLHQTKTSGCEPTIIVSHAIENAMAIQRNRASGTMNHVSLVANNCLTKECGITFLVKEECVTLRANIQSSLVTG
ncbi:hypothetical protein G9A89_000828 [Geosiphon pyriformis]|nr:hypothetical protein G9A89_000828 [Geosiphon pyriformis]